MPSMEGKKGLDNQVFFQEAKFNASLKGIVDIQGRLTEPFTLVIAMESRNSGNDKNYNKYNNYLALHVDHQKAWFSIKRNGLQVGTQPLHIRIFQSSSKS